MAGPVGSGDEEDAAAAGIVGDGAGAELVDDGVSGGVSSMKPKNSWSGSVSSTIGRP